MGKSVLQCLLIGNQLKVYNDLTSTLNGLDLNIQIRRVDAEKTSIIRMLKKLRVASLIFISDETPFSVEVLSDIVWQYASDAIVIIVTERTISTSLKTPFNNTQFSKLHYVKNNNESILHLQYLIQNIQVKCEFRRCKRLLGISEKRCQWLVDSSNDAIAFVSRNLHLYANAAYLGLLNINSVHELPSIPVKELVVVDEHDLFDNFVKKQISHHKLGRSLVVSMQKKTGGVFRANIHAIPTVFKGSKCLQLWVKPLSLYEFRNDKEQLSKTKLADKVLSKKADTEVLMSNTHSSASMLKGIIKRKEAMITAQKLVDMKGRKNNITPVKNHMLSLKVPVAQRVGIDDLLFQSGGAHLQEKRQIFWDKVKLARLLQILIRKKALKVNLFVRLSEASVSNKAFIRWFLPGLNRVGKRTSHLTFLLPSQVDERHTQLFMKFAKELRSFNCKIALDDFSVSLGSRSLLKHVRPDYVRLSLSWVRQIEGNDARELALGSFIRQLESKNIKVVAPCGFSKEMRKLFALSGVSFCQERTLKSG